MTPDETIRQAAAFYQKYRIENQRDYYEQRAGEYDSASQQLSTVTTLLLAVAFVAGLAGALGLVINRTAWGIVAAVCSALVAAIAGWGTLMGFQQNATSYRGAGTTLRQLGGRLADPPSGHDALLSTVVQVEEVLQAETGQWGQQLIGSAAQLASQLPLPLPPATTPERPADGSQPP